VSTVSVGRPKDEEWAGKLKRTAIAKRPVQGVVAVHLLGLAGDQVADTKNHGGPDKAVYAFAREDLDWWARELGKPLPDGVFGENLTTHGIDVNEALVGERWRIGTALLEVASIRIPCSVFASWMGVSGYHNGRWIRRFTAVGRPGPYLRVLEEGELAAGDEVVVEHRPDHDVTVSTMFRALTTRRELLPELLAVDGLVAEARARAEAYVATLPVG
jgi:MOSC domain-containing protein YiiM